MGITSNISRDRNAKKKKAYVSNINKTVLSFVTDTPAKRILVIDEDQNVSSSKNHLC